MKQIIQCYNDNETGSLMVDNNRRFPSTCYSCKKVICQ